MERCPNCRARIDGRPECRRCGMEVALLQSVEQAAERALSEALAELAQGRPAAAARAAERALALRRTPAAEQVAQFLRQRRDAAARDLLRDLTAQP
ncbi:MAG: hypothetical protein GVY09_10770 [Gammaproteobacteria bacterium]|nr:hypothetical protein [Gammaproteobacteria bacterium]